MTDENCKELLNIKYKNMLLNPNNNIFNNEKDSKKTLDDFLEINTDVIKIKSWSQLNKIEKSNKINDYVDTISSEYELSSKDIDDLKQYLRQCLSRKQLQRIKDVQYEKKEGVIKKINGLQIKKGKLEGREKRFTLKNVDKKDSTLKNLGGGKQKRNKLLVKHKRNKKESKKETKKETKKDSDKSD